MNKRVQEALMRAILKGLQVRQNIFKSGWSIRIPGGSNHHSPNDDDMISFVNGY